MKQKVLQETFVAVPIKIYVAIPDTPFWTVDTPADATPMP